MKKTVTILLILICAFAATSLTACKKNPVLSIALSTKSTHKKEYDAGDPLDVTGLKIDLLDKNKKVVKTVSVTADMVTGFKTYLVDEKDNLTITYQGFKTTFQISYIAIPVKIELSTGSTDSFKKNYHVGEEFDLTNMEIFAENKHNKRVHSDNIKVTEDMVSGFDSSKAGPNTITVTWNGLTTQYTLSIIE